MLHRLNPFRYDFDTQRLADFNNRRDYLPSLRRCHNWNDQLSINLQSTGLQLEQADYGGVTCTKIVYLYVDTKLLYPLDIPSN